MLNRKITFGLLVLLVGIAFTFGRSTPVSSQALQPGLYAPILMYHRIENARKKSPYLVSPAVFDQQLHWLQENGYHAVSYDDFYHALTGGGTLPEKPFVITFDDGYRNQYANALPLLKKYNDTAMFFIYTKALSLPVGMTWTMLQDLVANNMEIGAHTLSHANLRHLRLAAARTEIVQSKQQLENHLGISVPYFAYPYGAYSPSIINEVQKAGFLSAVTTLPGPYHEKNENPYLVKRVLVQDSLDSLIKHLTQKTGIF